MKRFFAFLFFIFCMYNLLSAQIDIGLRDSKYANISYSFKNRYSIKLEHSIYSGKISTQYVRGILSSCIPLTKTIDVQGGVYYGMPYNGTYYNLGARIDAYIGITNRVRMLASINPHYDSYFYYKTSYKIGALCIINPEIDFVLCYSTIPEYRQVEKRFNAGLKFHVRNLRIYPYLSFPLEKPIKSVRVLVSFDYSFTLIHK